ncbi:MAG: hypothetical protein DI553_00475 [Cutibacterium acnes]|nr:MAG: hypothetical protein DI553_00475 [Cutibacterium acnes]
MSAFGVLRFLLLLRLYHGIGAPLALNWHIRRHLIWNMITAGVIQMRWENATLYRGIGGGDGCCG